MSLVSHALAGMVGINIGALLGWVIANARVRTPGTDVDVGEVQPHEKEDRQPAVLLALEEDADPDRFVQEARAFDEVVAADKLVTGIKSGEADQP